MQNYTEWVKASNPGNYVSVDVTGLPTNFVSTLPGNINTKPHITLMYSKDTNVPFSYIDYVLSRRKLNGVVIPVIGVDVFDNPAENEVRDEALGCIVLKVESPILTDIHNHLIRIGCKHSYDEYSPHATLIYNCPLAQCHIAKADIEKQLKNSGLFLTCTTTHNEHVKENWANSLT
jgi:hypothetical protein